MKKYLIIIVFLFGFSSTALALSPTADGFLNGKCVVASLCGSEIIDQKITELRQQIVDLTAQLDRLLAQKRNDFCYLFNQDFSPALDHPDLMSLKKVLEFEKVPNVFQFQAKYGIKQTGYVGPLTRAKLNSLYGCKTQVKPGITVTSPNGGENWVANSVQDIKWANNIALCSTCLPSADWGKVDLYLDHYVPGCILVGPNAGLCPLPVFLPPYVLDKSIAGGLSGIYHWIVATDIADKPIPAGQYLMRICPAGATTNCDSSNNPFTITSGITQSPAISALSPVSAAVGTQVTITGSGFTSTGNKIKFGDLNTELNPSYSLNSTNNGTTLTFTVPTSRYYACSAGNPPCLVAQYLTPPGVYPVSVTNANGTSNTVNFTVFSVTN